MSEQRIAPRQFNELGLEALGQIIRNRVGLILGPGATHRPGFLDQLSNRLSEHFGVEEGATVLDTADFVIESGREEPAIRAAMREFIGNYAAQPDLRAIAQVRWAAVLSACYDSRFDDAFAQDSQSRASRHQVTVLADLYAALPPRNVPVFKLLGSLQRDDFACSSFSYRTRRSTWATSLRVFADLVQGAPILCIGMSDCPWVLEDIIAAMLASHSTLPSTLILHGDDPLIGSTVFRRSLVDRVTVLAVQAPLPTLIKQLLALETSRTQLRLPYGDPRVKIADAIRPYGDFLTLVNAQLVSSVSDDERNRLTDILFSPSLPRWDPFVYGLDLPRSVAAELLPDLVTLAESRKGGPAACVITGGAATGKTTILKRIAFDLAQAGHHVIWMSPAFYQDGPRAITNALARLAEHLEGKRLFLVMDDPRGFPSMTPTDVAAAAAGAGIEVILLVGVRASEWGLRQEEDDFTGGLPLMVQSDVADEFDDAEWARLPTYLSKLGVFPDIEAATRSLRGRASRSARDTLSMLFWMLPGTRLGIQQSVRDEYFRLGDTAAFTRLVIGQEAYSSELLRRAYEMVAVAAHRHTSVPVEVLVTALDVPYAEWLDASGTSGWRLFYPELNAEGNTTVYRTRNAIVTEVILDIINGGRLGHSGELRVLQDLLGACTGTNPQYREFCLRVLVPSSNLNDFDYLEGLDLFDKAIAALPLKDRTILHHRGIWIRNSGNDPNAAREALTDALNTPPYPYATRGEADEHIYTSLAANEVDALERGLVSVEDASERVLGYLRKARSSFFFNPHAVHVEAGVMKRLIQRMGISETDRTAVLNEALMNVDRTLMLLQHRQLTVGVSDSVQMLEEARNELFDLATPHADLQAEAERLWTEFTSQEGFLLYGRSLYRKASVSDKGTDYFEAQQYVDDTIQRVSAEGSAPTAPIYELWMQIHYHWRILRKAPSGTGGSIDWNRLRDYSAVLAGSRSHTARHFMMYVKGLSLAHLGRWPESMTTFAEIRRLGLPNHVLFAPRDRLVTSDGRIAVLQGVITQGGTRTFLKVADLHTDFFTGRSNAWPRPGEIAHANIQFSFGGPTAIPVQQ